jgi:Fe-S-cluster containining protein
VTHQDIPLYPLELQGLIWYVTKKFSGPDYEVLKNRLESFSRGNPCPFLIERACSIHPMRPMACRQFNVFVTSCEEGEDPFHTRRHDVMDPVKKHVDQAFFIMLPYHGIEKESDRIKFIEAGEMHKMVRELHGCNWKALAGKMERRD